MNQVDANFRLLHFGNVRFEPSANGRLHRLFANRQIFRLHGIGPELVGVVALRLSAADDAGGRCRRRRIIEDRRAETRLTAVLRLRAVLAWRRRRIDRLLLLRRKSRLWCIPWLRRIPRLRRRISGLRPVSGLLGRGDACHADDRKRSHS